MLPAWVAAAFETYEGYRSVVEVAAEEPSAEW